MIHCSAGTSTTKYRSLAMDAMEFTFTGQTAHAASAPWEGRNALNGLQLLFHALDMLRQHITPEARIHGIYHEGGAAPNIVPDLAVGRFYFRAPKRAYLDKMMETVLNCARGAALATETEVAWRPFEASFKDVLPAPTAEALLADIFGEFGVPLTEGEGYAGSSDVGDVSYRCPALQPKLDIADGTKIAAHTREFAAVTISESGHKALETGAKILGRAAIAVFLDEGLRTQLKQDFETELAKANEV
jgi:metal-dependent amidase/aminoacylase/carboxypeptidase family protein